MCLRFLHFDLFIRCGVLTEAVSEDGLNKTGTPVEIRWTNMERV